GQEEAAAPAFLVRIQLIVQRDTRDHDAVVFDRPLHDATKSCARAERAEVNLLSESPQARMLCAVRESIKAGNEAQVIDTVTGRTRGAEDGYRVLRGRPGNCGGSQGRAQG